MLDRALTIIYLRQIWLHIKEEFTTLDLSFFNSLPFDVKNACKKYLFFSHFTYCYFIWKFTKNTTF